MTFPETVMAAFGNKELLSEFDRLHGTSLSTAKDPIIQMIDETTGLQDQELIQFIAFVDECVWSRLPKDDAPLETLG
jgi:hypothetical protein